MMKQSLLRRFTKGRFPNALGGKTVDEWNSFCSETSALPVRSKTTNHAGAFPISDYAGSLEGSSVDPKWNLDRERRGGGWGAVSGDISTAVGGVKVPQPTNYQGYT